MRYVVLGAGAVGSVIGGRLHAAGADVVLVARGAHLDALQTDGLRLLTPDADERLDVRAVASVGELELVPDDVVVISVKSQDTASALGSLSAMAPPEIAVVCAQNGVANERAALRVFANVYAMYTWLPAAIESPGVVIQSAAPTAGALHLGRYPSGLDHQAEQLAADLRRADFACDAMSDVMPLKYRKLLANLGNALDALTGEWFGTDILDRAQLEAESCFRAAGIAVQSAEDADAMGSPVVREVVGHPWGGSSSRQSLARRTGSIETDFLNGEVVLLGRLNGVATPVNQCLQQLAQRAAREGSPPGTMSIAQIEAAIAAGGSERGPAKTS